MRTSRIVTVAAIVVAAVGGLGVAVFRGDGDAAVTQPEPPARSRTSGDPADTGGFPVRCTARDGRGELDVLGADRGQLVAQYLGDEPTGLTFPMPAELDCPGGVPEVPAVSEAPSSCFVPGLEPVSLIRPGAPAVVVGTRHHGDSVPLYGVAGRFVLAWDYRQISYVDRAALECDVEWEVQTRPCLGGYHGEPVDAELRPWNRTPRPQLQRRIHTRDLRACDGKPFEVPAGWRFVAIGLSAVSHPALTGGRAGEFKETRQLDVIADVHLLRRGSVWQRWLWVLLDHDLELRIPAELVV